VKHERGNKGRGNGEGGYKLGQRKFSGGEKEYKKEREKKNALE